MIDEFGIDEQRETGFGTGLRAHLTRDALAPPPGHAPPPLEHRTAPEHEHEPEREPVRWEGEPAPAPELAGERASALEAYAAELADRDRRLAEAEAELADESHRLAAADAVRSAAPRPVRHVLREHAEQEAERIVLTFEQALEATEADGRPDFPTRLAALRLLLHEAYGEPGGAESQSRVDDELAELRRRRGLA